MNFEKINNIQRKRSHSPCKLVLMRWIGNVRIKYYIINVLFNYYYICFYI